LGRRQPRPADGPAVRRPARMRGTGSRQRLKEPAMSRTNEAPARSVFETPPAPLDPVAAGRILAEMAEHGAAAVLACAEATLKAEPLPYDPIGPARAFLAFNAALAADPFALAERARRNWEDWTALWRTMGERALGMPAEPVIEP